MIKCSLSGCENDSENPASEGWSAWVEFCSDSEPHLSWFCPQCATRCDHQLLRGMSTDYTISRTKCVRPNCNAVTITVDPNQDAWTYLKSVPDTDYSALGFTPQPGWYCWDCWNDIAYALAFKPQTAQALRA